MNPNTLTLAIIGHLVGDYLLQTDWMALNKKKRSWSCFVHAFVWTCSVMFFTGWYLPPYNLLTWTPDKSDFIFAVLLVTHFIQDRTQIILWWMRLPWKNQTQFASGPCAPWSIIVVDNVWHIVTLWAVWRFIS